jgi:hypothetical protein
MAIADHDDILQRLLSTIPPGWFGDDEKLNKAVLSASAKVFSDIYQLAQYVRLQTRIKTATEDNLDLISKDFLGERLPRHKDETDESYRNRILAWIFPFPSTRKGISDAIYLLTGRRPIIFEPWYAKDAGCYNATLYYNQSYYGTGTDSYDATFFITVFRPISKSVGFPALNYNFYLNYNGYFWTKSLLGREVTDDDIYSLLKAVKACGVTVLCEILD